jgi:tRNA nucleotidyltransferase/poly(A) polymerase
MINAETFSVVRDTICNPIQEAGFEAFIVGGAIRNAMLGIPIKDIDITTNAHPEDIESIFENTVPTGKQFGTITVIIKTDELSTYEVTTYRSEDPYSDSRHPDQVTFETDINKDLERRDFTINALAYNPITKEFIDNNGGLNDLSNGVISCIGNPQKRFEEDSLRIFRAFRFSAQLEFNFAPDTKDALRLLAPSFAMPAMERIQRELEKLMMSDRPSCAFLMLRDYGILKRLSDEFPKITNEQIIKCDSTKKALRWPMLLQNIDYKQVCKLLRFGKKRCRYIHLLIDSNLDERKAFATVKELAVSSSELMTLGYSGVHLGQIQSELLTHILDHPKDNTTDTLMAIAKKERNEN